jgi:hypothetical protein
MQTLGLSIEARRSDGRLKSLFWPSVENAWDVDYLGQQGMWICTVVAGLSLVAVVFAGNLVVVVVAILTALFYWVGGMGVRQANWPAAAMVFLVYAMNTAVLGFGLLTPTGIIHVACALVLLSNVRAAFLASEWKPAAEETDRPTRFGESLADMYIDQMPEKLWAKLQIPFIVLAIAMLLLSLLAVGVTVAQRMGLMQHP